MTKRIKDARSLQTRSILADIGAKLFLKPPPSKVLLRSVQTGLYYGGKGLWVFEPKNGLDFERVESAARAYWQLDGMKDMVVVLWTEKPDCELTLPVPSDW